MRTTQLIDPMGVDGFRSTHHLAINCQPKKTPRAKIPGAGRSVQNARRF